jgi:NADH-dependent peroxiredoxin subunit C
MTKTRTDRVDDAGLSLRGTFIIDPDGVLKAIDIHDNSIGRSAEEILRKVQAASLCANTKGKSARRVGNRGKRH